MKNCPFCSELTPKESVYCQNCGKKITSQKVTRLSSILNIVKKFVGKAWRKNSRFSKSILTNLNKRKIVTVLVAILIIVGAVFITPKAQAYVKVNNIIKQAENLKSQEKYSEALEKLKEIEKFKPTNKQKEIVSKSNEVNKKLLAYKSAHLLAIEKNNAGKLEEARTELQKIDSEYTKYDEVRTLSTEVQSKIEANLKEEIKKKEADAKKAAARAASESKRQAKDKAEAIARAESDKAAAEAQAQAALAQKAQAEASAAAAARAAAEAQAQAEYLRNAQTSAYIDKWKRAGDYMSRGHRYVNSANQYIQAGSFSLALTSLVYALDDYTAAKNILGNDYIPEMATSHKYLQIALDYYISAETSLYNAVYYLESSYLYQADTYTDQANYYLELSNSYIGKY